MKSKSLKKRKAKPKAKKKAAQKIVVQAPVKRGSTLFVRVKAENVKYIQAEAKKAKVSNSMYVDQVIDQLRGN